MTSPQGRAFVRVAKILGMVVAVAAVAMLNRLQEDRREPQRAAPKPPPKPVLLEIGPRDAPVVIKAFYDGEDGFTCHTLDAFANLAGRSENLVRVIVHNTRSPEGRAQRQVAGLTADGFTVNGMKGFKRPLSAYVQQVDFVEPVFPYGRAWHRADLQYLVLKLLREELGEDASLPDLASEARANDIPTGNPDAKVKIVVYYPVPEDCVDETMIVLREVIADREEYVHLRLSDTCTDEGRVSWAGSAIICHGIEVNDHQDWDVKAEDGDTRVRFAGPIGGDWTREHLEAVLDSQIARLYGTQAPAGNGDLNAIVGLAQPARKE